MGSDEHLTARMLHGERRRRRPTPREPTLSLAELLDASCCTASGRAAPGRAAPGRVATERPRGEKDGGRSTSRRKQAKRSVRGQSRPSEAGGADGRGDSRQAVKVAVGNVVAADEIEDPDERAKVEEELRAQLSRHGRLGSLGVDDATGAVTAAFPDQETAQVSVLGLHGIVHGSRVLSARVDASVGRDQSRAAGENATGSGVARRRSKRRSKMKSDVVQDRARRNQQQLSHHGGETLGVSKARSSTLVIRNLLDPEELEDDDEYADVYQEVRDSLSKFGAFEKLKIARERGVDGLEIGSILVQYGQMDAATQAFEFYDSKVFGGRCVACEWVGEPVTVRVVGAIDPEELEDPDEFEDVRAEVSEYFAGYKHVAMVEVIRESGDCIVECESHVAASDFISRVRASKYGGRLLDACRVERELATDESNDSLDSLSTAPSQEAPRQEAPPVSSAAVTELAIALLQRLASLQERAHTQNPLQDKRSRRLVIGLHEVRRGISQQKIKLLVVGTDLEDAKPIGDAVGELVTAAHQQDVPVIYPTNRRKLGRVLKKSVRVSCVGVYSVDGANDIFRQLLGSI